MGRPKGSRNYGAVKPWDKYGLSEGAYRKRLRNGIPLNAAVKRGRKKSALTMEYERVVEEFGKQGRKTYGRYSGREYENDQAKLDAIREKYRNGVSCEMIEEWIMGL